MGPRDKTVRDGLRVRVGFTLVELLVVIGVIAVLVSLLLPALSRARASASALKCNSNLRQIGVAMRMYANDNKNVIIPALYVDPNNTSTEQKNWALILMEGKYLPPQSKPGGNGAFDGPGTVLVCPDYVAERSTTYSPSSQRDAAGARFWRIAAAGSAVGDTTYGVNATVDFGATLSVPNFRRFPFVRVPMAGGPGGALVTQLHKWTEIRKSSELVMVFDGIWLLNANMNRVNLRHNRNRFANAVFADGHVESLPAKMIPPSVSGSAASVTQAVPYPKWRLDQ